MRCTMCPLSKVEFTQLLACLLPLFPSSLLFLIQRDHLSSVFKMLLTLYSSRATRTRHTSTPHNCVLVIQNSICTQRSITRRHHSPPMSAAQPLPSNVPQASKRTRCCLARVWSIQVHSMDSVSLSYGAAAVRFVRRQRIYFGSPPLRLRLPRWKP